MSFRQFDGLDLPYRIYWDIFNPLTICRKDATEDGFRREGKALMIPWWSRDRLSIFQKLDFLDWSVLSTYGFKPPWSLADYKSTWVDSFMGLIQNWTRQPYPIFCFSTMSQRMFEFYGDDQAYISFLEWQLINAIFIHRHCEWVRVYCFVRTFTW